MCSTEEDIQTKKFISFFVLHQLEQPGAFSGV